MIGLAVLALLGPACTSNASAPPAPAPAASPGPVPGTVGDLFGINEAVAIPQRIVRGEGLAPDQVARHLARDARAAREVGARWVRANSASYPFTSWYEARRAPAFRERVDRWVAIVQAEGLDPLLVVGPWPGNRTASYTDAYVPDDLDGYRAWVRALVERYDGDGADDMPDLRRPIRAWEVDNEPDLHNRVPPRGGRGQVDPSTFETPDEYARVLVATADAIRAADPSARVLNGGTFHTARPWGRAYLERVLAAPGAAAAVDALSVHAYFEERTPALFEAALDNAALLAGGRPVWVTETGVPSSRRGSSWVDPNFQARMVAFVIGESLARGVERVAWHTLADPPDEGPGAPDGPNPYATHSLFRNPGGPADAALERKPSGDVFARLAAHLGAVGRGDVVRLDVAGGRAVRAGGLVLVYEGERVAVPASPGAEVLDLVTGARIPHAGPVAAPALVIPAGG